MLDTNERNLKTMVTAMSSISVYDKSGSCLFGSLSRLADMVVRSSQLAERKMGKNAFLIEIEGNDPCIIRRSLRFVVSMIWTPQIHLNLEDCALLLKRLINFLESEIFAINRDVVAYYCKKFGRALF